MSIEEIIEKLVDKKYKEIEKDDLIRFDFTNDGSCDKYKKIEEPLKKILTYKIRRGNIISNYLNAVRLKSDEIDKEYKTIIDPDSKSTCLQIIYKTIWDSKYYEECIDKNDKHICGETMNTLFTTFNKFVRYIAFKDVYKKESEKFKDSYTGSLSQTSELYAMEYYNDSTTYGKPIEFIEEIYKYTYIIDFIKTYTTLGNFIPCPVDCNTPRGSGELKDYWDLTLACIYNYYLKNENKILYNKEKEFNLCHIISGEREPKKRILLEERYKKWLDGFKNWNTFVEKNFMQSFVENKDKNGDYGKPRELWEGHFDGDVLPQKDAEYKQFFMNAKKFINKRSELMVEALLK